MDADTSLVDTLLEALGLKAVPRTGWVRRGVEGPESVAAHSWGVAWLALALAPASLDRERLLTYAVLHDLAEVRVGDLTPADGIPAADKARRERRAMAAMTSALPDGDRLRAAFDAYEAQDDPEARYVRQLDRLDMALQAVAYAGDAGEPARFEEFLDSAGAAITHPGLVALLDTLRARLRAIISAH